MIPLSQQIPRAVVLEIELSLEEVLRQQKRHTSHISYCVAKPLGAVHVKVGTYQGQDAPLL